MCSRRGPLLAPGASRFSIGRRAAGYLSYALLGGVLLTGCSLLQRHPPLEEPVGLIVVLPIERAESSGTPLAGERERLAPHAEQVVTAQIYGVLSSSSQWRFVPDLSVAQALGQIPPGDLATRARALGKAVSADAALCGTVSRYREREGTELGVREPASVSFSLQLVSVSSGTILWKGSFDETQRPLSSNLFNWWQFWKGGVRWFSAQQFTHIGVEHLLEDLADRVGNG